MNVSTLSTLSLVDLKQLAKGRRIKQYYIMKRHQLIQILALPELPERYRREKLTIHELREEAKRRGMRGFWALRREKLVETLFPEYHVHETAANQNQKDQGNTNKHDDPQKHDAEDVGVDKLKNGSDHGLDNVRFENSL
jgi:hypothetical protein